MPLSGAPSEQQQGEGSAGALAAGISSRWRGGNAEAVPPTRKPAVPAVAGESLRG